jgi:hypothetical protein
VTPAARATGVTRLDLGTPATTGVRVRTCDRAMTVIKAARGRLSMSGARAMTVVLTTRGARAMIVTKAAHGTLAMIGGRGRSTRRLAATSFSGWSRYAS